MQRADVSSFVPHRYPFLLIDRILTRDPGVSCVAERLISADDFSGSRSGVEPRGLLIEMLAQTCALVGEGPIEGGRLAAVRGFTIAGAPQPGDRLRLEARLVQTFRAVARFQTSAHREGECIAYGEVLVSTGEK
jgi:3-hydroxyacyl-[acyl-carrier-protein] dehydratase